MFDPDWQAGCPHCSLWADNFNGITVTEGFIAVVAVIRQGATFQPFSKNGLFQSAAS
jgi:predicted dithiol-disulfide oxidoreductase (DUF899 family)